MKTPNIVAPCCILNSSRHVLYLSPVKLPLWAASWDQSDLQASCYKSIDVGNIVTLGDKLGMSSFVRAVDVYGGMVAKGLLEGCLNLTDGVHIAAHEHLHFALKGAKVFLWKSVVSDGSGNLFVPQIQNICGQMPVIYWLWLEYNILPSKCLSFVPQD